MSGKEAPRPDRPGMGIALVVCAGLIFSLADSAAKMLVATLDPIQTFWIRCCVVLTLTVPVVVWRQGTNVFRVKRPGLQLARGLLVFVSSILFLTGLRSLALADATAINFIWPILITIFSVIFLSEKVGLRRALATLAGFVGMLIIMRPGSESFQAAAIFPLLGAVTWAGASVMTRVLSADDRSESTIIWSALVTFLAASCFLPFVWRAPTLQELGFACLLGLGSSMSHAMIVVAYGRAQASTLAPYAYAQLVFAAICGYVFFGTLPDRWVVLGSLVIAGSGLYTIHRERVRRLEREAAAQL